MRLEILILCAAAFLAACEAPQQDGNARTVTGTILGRPSWTVITDAESIMRIDAPPPIERIEATESLPSRYLERIQFRQAGSIMYERIYGAALDTSWGLPEMAYQALRHLGEEGVSITRDGFRTSTINGIPYAHGLFDAPGGACFLFFGYFGTTYVVPWGDGDRSVRGGGCKAGLTAAGAALQTKWLSLLSRLYFDGPKPGWTAPSAAAQR